MLRADVCHASEYARKSTNLRRDNMVINISSSLSGYKQWNQPSRVQSRSNSKLNKDILLKKAIILSFNSNDENLLWAQKKIYYITWKNASLCSFQRQQKEEEWAPKKKVEMFVCLYWFELKGARGSNSLCSERFFSCCSETSLKWFLLTALGCHSIYQMKYFQTFSLLLFRCWYNVLLTGIAEKSQLKSTEKQKTNVCKTTSFIFWWE